MIPTALHDPSAPSTVEKLHEVWAELTAPGAVYEMVEHVEGGVPLRTFKGAPNDLAEIWRDAAARGDRPYLVYEDERYTYGETDASVRAFAGVLQEGFQVKPGDRVALAMRNFPEWVIAYWATVSVGAVVVGMNAWWTGPEMAASLHAAQPSVIVVDDERLLRLRDEMDQLGLERPMKVVAVRSEVPLGPGELAWEDLVGGDAPPELPKVSIAPSDDAMILYTSGSTGVPKGVRLSHRGCVHNVMHLMFWNAVTRRVRGPQTKPKGTSLPPSARPQAVFMAPTPLFHVTACNCVLHPATISGARLVLTRRWDPGRALELIEREGVTNFSGVPTMNRDLVSHPDWARRDTSSLTSFVSGGAPLPPDLGAKIEASVRSGASSSGYGLTETSGVVTVNASMFRAEKPGSCGPLLPTVDAKLIDANGAVVTDEDAVGELWLHGPIITSGWVGADEHVSQAGDGWLPTGDIVRIDADRFVYIVDRAKDMVIRGGENVYAAEVEAAIYASGAAAEVAVVGVPDERLGEKVAAFIVPATGPLLDEAGLRSFLAARLAAHKIPELVWVQAEPLPRTATGKFDKVRLRTRGRELSTELS